MIDANGRFAERAIRRRPIFLALSGAGVVVGLGLAAYYAYRRYEDPSFPLGARIVIVILILLNARQNLRQHRYATLLAALMPAPRAERTERPTPGR